MTILNDQNLSNTQDTQSTKINFIPEPAGNNKNAAIPTVADLVANATGPLPYTLTNDYLFRALLQQNRHVLEELICSLLHLQPQDISSVEITNPIILGKAINEKEFILDIHVNLNSHTLIDLEMQVINQKNWPERSLGYLCRTFDNLNAGDNYINTKPAIHIGFLDFQLFPDHPEFYATYKLMNVKNNAIYSDKFILSVVDLNHVELATTDDREFQTDSWASLFKAKTWEEIKVLANNNNIFKEASETIYQLTADAAIREQCAARKAYYARERYYAELGHAYEEALSQNEMLTNEKNILATENDTLTAKNAALQKEIELLRAQLAARRD